MSEESPTLAITTNGHARPLVSLVDLPTEIRESEFDYLDHLTPEDDDAYTPRFFSYRGSWYDAEEFTVIWPAEEPISGFVHRVSAGSPLLRWRGIQTDSAFSAVVLRFALDWDGMQDSNYIVVGSVVL